MLGAVSEAVYHRLFHELNAARFDSDVAQDALAELGAPALLLRALARARRHGWSSARADARAAIERLTDEPAADVLTVVAGATSFVARDYHHAIRTLTRAAGGSGPAGVRARKLASEFCTRLGWASEHRRIVEAALAGDRRGHARRLQRQAARHRRADQALSGPPEQAAERAYALLFRDGPEAAAACLDALSRQYPRALAVVAARMRVDLLTGDVDAAGRRLDALTELERAGLGSERTVVALERGDTVAALHQTLHYGGEAKIAYLRSLALLARDRLDDAAEMLEAARIALPRSVPISLALAMTRHRQNPDTFGEGLERRFEDLLDWAPALLADAADEAGVALWTDQGALEDRADKVTIIQRAHAMLTADRDPFLASYVRDGELRHLAPARLGPAHASTLHAGDLETIQEAERLLIHAIGVRPPPPPRDQPARDPAQRGGPWRPQYLSAAQIEQFLTDGFIVLPAAFDRAIADRWRADGNRRIREEPERWVRGYDPEDPSRSLAAYSPDDPESWTWPRIDLEGPETVDIEAFSPDAWRAICDLLGGPERIKTRSWTNYLIINFNDDAHLGVDAPSPDWGSWHIDDPSPTTRLDRIRNGLVCITLMNDLPPKSGNTWIAPDSVGRVARELHAHPEGVDFVADRGCRITMQCERFHEVVGNAGDILIMHPLMMHSSAPNRSGRIRWMGNPMVYMNEPLDPYRPVAELSPVELAIHRAIR